MPECEAADCGEQAAVLLHEPRRENRRVCLGHARVLVQRDGVVAEPLDLDEWPVV